MRLNVPIATIVACWVLKASSSARALSAGCGQTREAAEPERPRHSGPEMRQTRAIDSTLSLAVKRAPGKSVPCPGDFSGRCARRTRRASATPYGARLALFVKTTPRPAYSDSARIDTHCLIGGQHRPSQVDGQLCRQTAGDTWQNKTARLGSSLAPYDVCALSRDTSQVFSNSSDGSGVTNTQARKGVAHRMETAMRQPLQTSGHGFIGQTIYAPTTGPSRGKKNKVEFTL